MENFKLGQKVRLAIDNKTVYEIIEINPFVENGIEIREYGTGNLVNVSSFEIFLIEENNNK